MPDPGPPAEAPPQPQATPNPPAPPGSAAPPAPGGSAPPPAEPPAQSGHSTTPTHVLALAALGVVFGDIGTSPLYAVRECFHGPHAIEMTPERILGVLSLIFWSLVVVISLKYVALVMRADNRGEGGILALMALVTRGADGPMRRVILMGLGLIGASLMFGDGVITPAISVLSAIEGLTVVTPAFERWVIPLTLVVIVGLFLVQRRGTHSVGAIFGPYTLVWFIVLAVLGFAGIFREPKVLYAVNPLMGARFLVSNPAVGFVVLGSVLLVITGGEALYADMGHFGRRPIRLGWFSVVMPALVLNYFGQGALLLSTPEAVESPFFLLAPAWARIPLVLLSTGATCIASQALISGVFSITRQAVQLGYIPRLEIVHTSASEIGQIYVPAVNRAMLVVVLAVVLGFRSSSALAGAYGIAVTGTMIITTVLAFFVTRLLWGWHWAAALLVCGGFLVVEVTFFSANLVKVLEGGWLPLGVGAALFTLMTTWKRGREILAERLRAGSMPLSTFLESFAVGPPHRVPGIAIFMTGAADGVPVALLHNLKHNKVLHERVGLLTVLNEEVPAIPDAERVQVTSLGHGMWRVVARYGFMENPNIHRVLSAARKQGFDVEMRDTTFFLGRETLIPSRRRGMALWREGLFAWMSRNARSATAFFRLPPNRVVELGAQIEI